MCKRNISDGSGSAPLESSTVTSLPLRKYYIRFLNISQDFSIIIYLIIPYFSLILSSFCIMVSESTYKKKTVATACTVSYGIPDK